MSLFSFVAACRAKRRLTSPGTVGWRARKRACPSSRRPTRTSSRSPRPRSSRACSVRLSLPPLLTSQGTETVRRQTRRRSRSASRSRACASRRARSPKCERRRGLRLRQGRTRSRRRWRDSCCAVVVVHACCCSRLSPCPRFCNPQFVAGIGRASVSAYRRDQRGGRASRISGSQQAVSEPVRSRVRSRAGGRSGSSASCRGRPGARTREQLYGTLCYSRILDKTRGCAW